MDGFKNLSEQQRNEYNISHESVFLDIGCGFGKPNFITALKVGCKSLGIDVVDLRVKRANETIVKLSKEEKFKHI